MNVYPDKKSLIFLGILTGVFVLLPIFDILMREFVNPYSKYFLANLYLFFPVSTLILAIIDSKRNGLCWWWVAAPFVLFFSTMNIYYNDSALIFCVTYAVIGAIGTIIGWLLWRSKKPIEPIEEL